MIKNINELTMMLSNEGIDTETRDGWEKWVCQPVVNYPFAPRYARAALEILGFLESHGVSIRTVLMGIAKEYLRLGKKPSDPTNKYLLDDNNNWKRLLLATIYDEWGSIDSWKIHASFFEYVQNSNFVENLDDFIDELKKYEAEILMDVMDVKDVKENK